MEPALEAPQGTAGHPPLPLPLLPQGPSRLASLRPLCEQKAVPPRSWPRDAPEQFSPAVWWPLWDCFLPGDPAGGQGRVTNTILPGGISGLLAGGSYVPRTVGSPRDPHDGYTWPTLQRRTKRAWSLLKAMSVLSRL